jgi:gliding motility-associated lipoprotein GldB
MKKTVLSLCIGLLLWSCNNTKTAEADILEIPVSFDVARFDLEFGAAQEQDLPVLKARYPYLFPKRYSDTFWAEKLSDTIQIELNNEVRNAFPNFKEHGDDLILLFKHIKYYFPEFESPQIVTVTSEVDYRNKVLISDSLMLIALDTYLGADHMFYEGISNFTAKNLRKEQLVPDVAAAYAKQLVPRYDGRTFVGLLIYYGKLLYMIEQFAPFVPEEELMGYSKEEFAWAQANESEIWRYFIERKLLFSTDAKLPGRFLNPAPFSKFYLELDNESPGMVGRYIGWQIVRSYMKNNDVSLRKLVTVDPTVLFQNAKFKPQK